MVQAPGKTSLAPCDFDSLTAQIPELNKLDISISTETLEETIDSSNMHPRIWLFIANMIKEQYDAYDGFVILHGSDTMAYTASGLSFALENLSKPVILTGSQLPMGVIRTDGKENFLTALEIAAAKKEDGSAMVPEVAIYFEYKLYRGNRTYKYSAENFDAFHSPNYPILAEAGVHIKYKERYIYKANGKPLQVNTVHSTDVAVVHLFPGISENALKPILLNENIRGIVLLTYGAGNASTATWFIDLLIESIEQGKLILNVSQCQSGTVYQGKYDTSALLNEIGVFSGADMTTEAAVTKLMYLLGYDFSKQEIEYYLSCSLRGEITL